MISAVKMGAMLNQPFEGEESASHMPCILGAQSADLSQVPSQTMDRRWFILCETDNLDTRIAILVKQNGQVRAIS